MVDDASPDGASRPADARAADEFDVELRPRPGGPVVRALRLLAAVGAGLFAGLVPVPSTSDLVVTRRGDGSEVSRTPAGEAEDAAALLRHVRAASQEQSVERFLQAWGAAPTRR